MTVAHYRAQAVEESGLYTLREVFKRGTVARYRPRGMAIDVHVRHGSSDGNVVQEFTMSRLYDPPREILERIGDEPRLLDLGGHVGLFGAHAFTLWPGAHVTSFEPDPDNAAMLELTARGVARWQVVRAAAWVADGELMLHQDFAGSSVDPTRGEIRVEAVDVFPYLERVDFVKIDIEGAEWVLLGDPRFSSSAPRTLILECHPGDTESKGVRSLRSFGYETRRIEGAPPGAAMLWAWR